MTATAEAASDAGPPAQDQVTDHKDVSISLVVIQGYLPDEDTDQLQDVVTRLCERLNILMDSVHPNVRSYHSYRNENLMVDAPAVGERKREYAKETYWELLKQKKAQYKTTYVIGVCGHPLQESSFNFESREDGVAVVSAAGYAQYRPPGLTRERYLMYLITCVTLILENPAIKEHRKARACLFDVCVLPEHVTAGLRRPSLRHCCNAEDGQLRHLSDQYLAPFEAVLADVRRRDPLAIMNSSIGTRTTAFLAGVVSGFITHLLVSQWARAAVSVVWVGITLVAAFFLLRAAERTKRVQRHRGRTFWALAALSIGIAAGGVVLGAVKSWPPLHSEGGHQTVTCVPISPGAANSGPVKMRCH